MIKIFLLIIFSLFVSSCNEDEFSEITTNLSSKETEDKSDLNGSKQNDFLLINSLKNYEINSHIQFQKELYETSDNYIRTQSEKFVDNETGFFKLWSEVFSFFESDTKRNARWKSRVEKYFRTTEYVNYIKEKQNNYSSIINTQRKELLGKIHTINKGLVIKTSDVNSVTMSNKEVSQVVEKVNSLVLTEVIPEVIESFLIPVVLSALGLLFGLVFAWKTKGLIFLIALFFSVWYSFKYSSELESSINESFALKEKQHLTILPELQQNTMEYYKELTLKIK